MYVLGSATHPMLVMKNVLVHRADMHYKARVSHQRLGSLYMVPEFFEAFYGRKLVVGINSSLAVSPSINRDKSGGESFYNLK